MSTVKMVADHIPNLQDKIIEVVWPNMQNGDDGTPFQSPEYGDRVIQVTGTFGAGGNAELQGSLDGVNWTPLNDPQGNPLELATQKIESIMEIARYMRPVITSGDGTTSLTVRLLLRRGF